MDTWNLWSKEPLEPPADAVITGLEFLVDAVLVEDVNLGWNSWQNFLCDLTRVSRMKIFEINKQKCLALANCSLCINKKTV